MEAYIKSKNAEMLDLIQHLVNIDSGSYVKTGIDQIGSILTKKFKELGFIIEVKKKEDYGNHLVIRHKQATNPKIILLAHMDTVFPEGTVAERPFHIEGNKAFGPGVVDMKSSLVELLYAIRALDHSGSDSIENIEILLNSDEEIGSPSSRTLIEERAIGKEYALVMEPARKDGSLVTARRGGGRYTLMVKGKAAHSGIEPEKGRSAIEELAYKIIQLHDLTDHKRGMSVNVGIIEGGTAVNAVSDSAVAHVDVRISEMDQAEYLEEKMKQICATTEVPGTNVVLEGEIGRPPMEHNDQTKTLFHIIKDVGKEIGVKVSATSTGGGGDASFTAANGVATVDGLGPVGGNAHSDKEYVEIDTIPERTLLLAKTIDRLSGKE